MVARADIPRADIQSVLMQMRQVRTEMQQQALSSSGALSPTEAVTSSQSFAERMQQAQSQMQANKAINQSISQQASAHQTSAYQNSAHQNSAHQNSALQNSAQSETATKIGQSYPYVTTDPNVPSFDTMFNNAINEVNRKQRVATDLATKFELGDPQVDLPEVMVALQKASVSFQAMTEVRNKLVEAYKDIMNMPV